MRVQGVPWRGGDREPGGIAIEETVEATDSRGASRDAETEVRGGLDDGRGCGPIQDCGEVGHGENVLCARPGGTWGVYIAFLSPGCGDGDCAGDARPTGDLAWHDEGHAAARGTDRAL